HQRLSELCGSQSSSATRPPSLAAWTARAVAIVLFPDPPFVEATAIVMGRCFMVLASHLSARKHLSRSVFRASCFLEESLEKASFMFCVSIENAHDLRC